MSQPRVPTTLMPSIGVINLVVFSSITIFFFMRIDLLPKHLALYVFPFLVFFTAMDQGFAAYLLKMGPFQWIGERSYSIYLWHAVCLSRYTHFFKTHLSNVFYYALVIVLICVISDVSYRFFECPFREVIRRLGRTQGLTERVR